MFKKYRLNLVSACGALFFTAVTAFAANDQASFGRSVKYLDVSTLPFGTHWFDLDTSFCAARTSDKCVQIPSLNTETTVNEIDIARIDLPAYASHSLLCASISPTITISFANTSTSTRHVQAFFNINGTVKSSVLNNPALINKLTGQPFNGKIEITALTRVYETFSLVPKDYLERDIIYTRHCVGGLISTRTLKETYGLSDFQARSVFANPMTVTISARGTIDGVAMMYMAVPFRLYGD